MTIPRAVEGLRRLPIYVQFVLDVTCQWGKPIQFSNGVVYPLQQQNELGLGFSHTVYPL